MADQESKVPLLGLSEALLLALLTANAYVAAYAYERSICTHFGIPEELIKISPEVLVASFLGTSGFAWLAFFYGNIAFRLVAPTRRDPESTTHLILLAHAIVACFGVMLSLAFGFSWRGLGLFALFVLIIDLIVAAGVGIALLPFYLLRRRSPEAAVEAAKAVPPDALTVLLRHIERRYLIAVGSLVVANIVAAFAGIRVARTQDQFFTIESKNLAIVRGYGDLLICKPTMCEKGEKLGASTIVLTRDQVANLPITLKKYDRPPEIEKP